MIDNAIIKVLDIGLTIENSKLYHGIDFFKMCIIHPKSILHYTNKSITIDQPALVFSNPLISYEWEPISKKQDGYSCLFTQNFITNNAIWLEDSPLFKIGTNNVFFLKEHQAKYITSLFKKIKEEINNDYENKQTIISNYISIIVHEALKINPSSTFNHIQSAAARITSLFLGQLNEQFPITKPHHCITLKTPNDFSSHLSVHINHLNDSVKSITGKSTSTHIRERLILEAESLLHNTDWNVSEIAYSLGFKYPNNFSKFFKLHTGKSPMNLREPVL